MTIMKRIGLKKCKMNMIHLIRSEKRYNERQMTWK